MFQVLLGKGADSSLFKENAELCFPSGVNVIFSWSNTEIKRIAFAAIEEMENQIQRCRSAVLCFVWCCKRTGLIHSNVGRDIIAKKLLWPTRRKKVWSKKDYDVNLKKLK